MFSGGRSEADDEIGRRLTSQDQSEAARKLGSPVGYLALNDKVRFHGYYWRGSSAPGMPMRQHMVDSSYRVLHGREVFDVSVRSWFGTRGTRIINDSFGFDSLLAVHAMDFLHSASLMPLEEARALVVQSLRAGGDHPDTSTLLVGDVSCELRFERDAVITIAVRPSKCRLDDLQVELLVTSP